ncbi:MAG: hypothetical protein GY859_26915 [Desulfobacterales bacterium]|nr:hypothetical protein [Desulfobacterales bacterium]
MQRTRLRSYNDLIQPEAKPLTYGPRVQNGATPNKSVPNGMLIDIFV